MEKATDVVLRLGGNNEEIRMELAFDAMIDKPIDEIAAHMRTPVSYTHLDVYKRQFL